MVRAFHGATRVMCFGGAFVILLFMVAVIAIDVSGRYLFNAPLHGGQDIVGMALFTLFVLILPYSFRGDFHVRMDLLYSAFPPWAKRVADIFGAAGAFAMSVALIYQTYVNIPRFYQLGAGTLEVQIPFWPFNVLLLASSVILLVSVVLTIVSKRPENGNEA